MLRGRLLALPVAVPAALAVLTGCSGGPEAVPGLSPTPTSSSPAAASSAPSDDGTVQVVVGSADPVTAEVADSPEERAVGLMRRASVPLGTGMVFLYDAPSTGRYYMYDVEVPLTAVFARGGRVVGVVDMPPCEQPQPQQCPTYGPDVPFDTVLETAPETLRGKVQVGDALRVHR